MDADYRSFLHGMDDEYDWRCPDYYIEAERRQFGPVTTVLNTFEGDPNCSNAVPRSADLLLGVFSSSPSESDDAQQHTQLAADALDDGSPLLQSHSGILPLSSLPTCQYGPASSMEPAFFQFTAGPLQNWETNGYGDYDFMWSQLRSHAPSQARNSTGSNSLRGRPATPSNPSHGSLASGASNRDAWRILTPNSSSNGTSDALTDFLNVSHQNEVTRRVDSQQVQHHAKVIALKPRLYPDRVNQTAGSGVSTSVLGATAPELPPRQSSLFSKEWVVPSSGKRKRLDDIAQRKTRKVRATGACIRCKMLNLKCDEYTPCWSCQRAETTAKVQWTPCYRSGFTGVIAFRAGNARAGVTCHEAVKKGHKWSSKLNWDGADIATKSASLSYPFKDLAQPVAHLDLIINCRKFIPDRQHVLSEPWFTPSGELTILISEPYGCDDTEENLESLQKYIDGCKDVLLQEVKDSLQDELIRYHLDAALEFAMDHDNSAVVHALQIQAMSYFARTRMVCAKSAGLHQSLNDDEYQSLAIGDKFPIPAHLDVQIDHMTIQSMYRQMERVKKRFNEILFQKKGNENWYEIYLSMFLLLCSLETVHTRQMDVIRRFQEQDDLQFRNAELTSHKMLGQWVHSAKTLLYHWRNVVKGQVVFNTIWNEVEQHRLRQEYHLNSSALRTMAAVNQIVSARAEELECAGRVQLDNYKAKPLVWLSRLWVSDLTNLDIQVAS